MTRGNLIHALVESWKFDPVINSHHHVYESHFSVAFKAGVDICDVKFSNLPILRYIVASKKSTKMFYYFREIDSFCWYNDTVKNSSIKEAVHIRKEDIEL